MAENDLKVIQKAKELATHTLKVTSNANRYPKKYRFSLVDKMQNKSMEIYEMLFEANRTDIKNYKRDRLEMQTKDRFGLVNVILDIKGEKYIISDIFLRMLKPEELKVMQGLVFKCEEDEKLTKEIHLYESKRNGFRITRFESELDINSLRYVDKFDIFMMRLDRAFCDITDIMDMYDDDVEVEAEPEASWN